MLMSHVSALTAETFKNAQKCCMGPQVILSRSLKQYTLAPLIDFLNHSSAVQSEVSYDFFTGGF